jgi:hypothetical protein
MKVRGMQQSSRMAHRIVTQGEGQGTNTSKDCEE